MTITLKHAGGLGPAVAPPARTLDVASLPAPAAADVARLVDAASRSGEAATGSARPRPDAFAYTIVVEDGGRVTTLRAADENMSPEFARLLDWLERHFAG